MKKIVLILSALSLLTGCAILQPPQTVVVSPRFPELDHESFAVLPFTDKRSGVRDDFGFNVADVVTDAFETEFMKSGYKIVERSLIDKVLREIRDSYQGNMDEATLKKIGKMTNADVIILGMVRDFKKAKYERIDNKIKCISCTTLSYSAKAIHIETGELLWKGSITRSSGLKGDMFAPCDCNGVRFSVRTSKTLVKKLLAKIDASLKKNDE